jgi:hypothetical protein
LSHSCHLSFSWFGTFPRLVLFRVALRLHGLISTVRLRTVSVCCVVYRVRYRALYILTLSCTAVVSIPSRPLLMIAETLLLRLVRLLVCPPACLLVDVVPGPGAPWEPLDCTREQSAVCVLRQHRIHSPQNVAKQKKTVCLHQKPCLYKPGFWPKTLFI